MMITAISATPAIDPITTPAMPPPDNFLPEPEPEPEFLLSLEALAELSELIVVVTSMIDGLEVPLDEPVTVEITVTSPAAIDDLEELDDEEELDSSDEEDVDVLEEDDDEDDEDDDDEEELEDDVTLELDDLLVALDRLDDREDSEDDDEREDRLSRAIEEPSTSLLT